MCNRFAFVASEQEFLELRDELGIAEIDTSLITPRYNIPPTTDVPIVRATEAGNKLSMVRWGLIPSWHKAEEKFPFLTNARSETAATKPSFRSAFKKRRCIIPATGFFEWPKAGEKLPHFFRLKEGLMPFAGLWEFWEGPNGPIESAAILTTDANELVGSIDHDRMPCILAREQFIAWLDPKLQDAATIQGMLRQYPPELMEAWEVDKRVNNVRSGNEPAMIERVA